VPCLLNPSSSDKSGGSVGEGIDARILRRICNVWVRAQADGVLGPSQEKIADKAQLLLNALADVAIIAIIDEATGYQKRRAHNALQAILAAYIAPELMPWQKRFPNSYYEQIYKVMGWKYDASSTARTAYVGKLTNKLIWDKLPPGVAQELRRLNPVDPTTGRRKRKHHQLLTDDVGHPHLQNQIMAVTTLMRATPPGGYRFFEVLFNNAFPPAQGDLFAALELDKLGSPMRMNFQFDGKP
jgi:P63C domain-containing protein